ncbi:MAG TPA: hypothetical protein VF734_13700, partial [Pseudonocardiaceae bacterium]
RSYGVGLARAAATAGLPAIEAEQPIRKHRRGKGKSDRIDVHLAVLYALGLSENQHIRVRALTAHHICKSGPVVIVSILYLAGTAASAQHQTRCPEALMLARHTF